MVGVEHLFDHFGSPVLALPHHNVLLIPSINVRGGTGQYEKEKPLIQCRHGSEITETLVCYQHCFCLKLKTQLHMSCSEVEI